MLAVIIILKHCNYHQNYTSEHFLNFCL